MSQPSREEVESFIAALRYGMKVSHKPEFLIALAEGWLQQHNDNSFDCCEHEWVLIHVDQKWKRWHCDKCCSTVRRFDDKKPF